MNITIGENIKRYREHAGLTQKQLGEKMGVSQQMIASYENGTRKPKPETLTKIANALGADYDALSGNYPKFSGNHFPKNYSLLVDILKMEGDKEIEKLLDSYDKLNVTGKQEAAKRVEELTHIDKYTSKEE